MRSQCCQRCEKLEAEVAYYRDELGLVENLVMLNELKTKLGLRGLTDARMLLRLMRAKKHTLTVLQLNDEQRTDTETSAVGVYVHRLRKAIGFDAIKTIWGNGFTLTPEGLTRIETRLAQP